jgi:hypothetical protein
MGIARQDELPNVIEQNIPILRNLQECRNCKYYLTKARAAP